MQAKKKLAILELITGIFGWVWIVTSIAALYYLAMVIFSNNTWTNFFWAFGASIIARWLAKGFRDNKIRLTYEAHFISEGLTPEEAAQKWAQETIGGE